MRVESTDDRPSTEAVAGVHLSQLAVGDRMSVQHYRFEPGATVPVHDHPHEQSGYLYRGALTFVLEDGTEREVTAGDGYDLAAAEPHGAENRGDEVALGVDVFSPPRGDPDWLE